MDELFIGCRNSDGIKNFVKSHAAYFLDGYFLDGYFLDTSFTRYGTALQDCADECNKVTSCWAFRHANEWSTSIGDYGGYVGVCHGYYNKESPVKIAPSKNDQNNKGGNVVYVKCINGRYITFLYEMFLGIVLLCYVHIIHI